MCDDCLIEARGVTWPEVGDEVLSLIGEIYDSETGGGGGPLHVVLDDCNVGDESIKWCLSHIDENPDWYTRKVRELSKVCGSLLLSLSEVERRRILWRFWGYEEVYDPS